MLTERWEGDETTGCFDCSMERCHHDKYANCARRIAHAAELARSRKARERPIPRQRRHLCNLLSYLSSVLILRYPEYLAF